MSRYTFQRGPPPQESGECRNGVGLAAGPEMPTKTQGLSAIFVPITTDLAAPMDEKPMNNIQRIEQTMRNVDAHTAKVKANIVQIMDREKQATMRVAKEMERAHPESAQMPAGITAEEFDTVARSLMAAPVPGKDYNWREAPPPDYHARGLPETLREDYSRKVLDVVEQAVHQVEGYGRHMEDIQNEYRRSLRAEIQRCAEKEAER